jgi:hypothetical protein
VALGAALAETLSALATWERLATATIEKHDMVGGHEADMVEWGWGEGRGARVRDVIGQIQNTKIWLSPTRERITPTTRVNRPKIGDGGNSIAESNSTYVQTLWD